MTAGVTYKEEKGVHVYRSAAPAPAAALLGGEPVSARNKKIKKARIEIRKRPWRTIRRLRTQGFYSGVPYPSRPYTQGFYSTGP